jgi:flagellar hook-basal body complex protein FliE
MLIAALPLVTSALSSLAPALGATAPAAAASAASAGGDFGAVMAQVSGDAVKKMKAAEAASLAGIEGRASAQDVVQSVMSAQESLQTVLAIRDKAVGAFQEVSRMSV